MQTIFDPLRKKEVALTPEERVRQWMIGVLSQELEVPLHMMMSEAGFKLGEKQFRADILIYDRKAAPLAVVECKRPEVELTPEVLDQVIRYNMVLSVTYMFITNGTRTLICRRRELDGRYGFIDKAPTYSEMLCQQ
ncbi:MAG: type I restriction enzyme HsdR N-terminal domain-containing protein [Bacteroidales bacterium]|nr:type I restriction enzyme HsdR N-terminal domain-containing protein [Bacteroidales bacterium]